MMILEGAVHLCLFVRVAARIRPCLQELVDFPLLNFFATHLFEEVS